MILCFDISLSILSLRNVVDEESRLESFWLIDESTGQVNESVRERGQSLGVYIKDIEIDS